jgi:hypothetical protein
LNDEDAINQAEMNNDFSDRSLLERFKKQNQPPNLSKQIIIDIKFKTRFEVKNLSILI